MRLEVFCEDRLGLTRELLDLLVLRGIDLRGIEIDPIGRIYLNFAELEFETPYCGCYRCAYCPVDAFRT